MAISKFVLPTKVISVAYPAAATFILDLKYISREVSRRITKDTQKLRMDSKDMELSDEAFNLVYAKEAFAGWKGLTYKVLSTLVLLDETQIEDMDAEVPFSIEDAAYLLTASQPFEAWVNKVVFELDSFRAKA